MSKWVPYHAESVKKAQELTEGLTTPLEKYLAITMFIKKNFGYDYVRAALIPKKNGLPDVEHCWNTRLGICMDTAALTVGMLRSVGVKANLCVGKADGMPHAWVEASINGLWKRFDTVRNAVNYRVQRRY